MTDPQKGEELPVGFVAMIVRKSLSSSFSILLLLASFFLGAAALLLTPEEEEPQIIVPIADIYVEVPGASAAEVEKLVSTPLEQLLWQIDGVEYVYSTSMDDKAVVTVRFYVSEDRERSWVKLYNKVNSHIDEAPSLVKGWVIKPIEIDDVPIVNLTLHSAVYSDAQLRRIAEEVRSYLEEVPDISRTRIVGGREEQVRVLVDPQRIKSRSLSLADVAGVLRAADAQATAGSFSNNNREFLVQTGPRLQDAEDLKKLVVGVYDGKPVYLSDVASVALVPEEPLVYSRINFKLGGGRFVSEQAVTIALSKKKGTNAVRIADRILAKVKELQATVLPEDVSITVTRDYGQTAYQKVKELVKSLFYSIATIVVILFVFLGVREGCIVALSVPFSFALALFTNYLFGYTINRVTLFALILTLGLVVDDPIINVDNIQRHILRGKYNPFKATLMAVQEVLPPVIISTLTIIASFVPMFFITGMMGPYMRPMAVNVPLAVTYSTVAALTVVPWAAYHLLKGKSRHTKEEELPLQPGRLMGGYKRFLGIFLDYTGARWALFAVVLGLIFLSGLLVVERLVPLKMLPFDNKNELQLVVDMPEGTTLEKTEAVVREFEAFLMEQPEVVNVTSYVGTHSPIDFNGLVRHYYFREAPNQADLRINLIDKSERSEQSHAFALQIRERVKEIAEKVHAKTFIVESPPGPPVVSTVVAEVYGAPGISYEQMTAAGKEIERRMKEIRGVVDIDMSAKEPGRRVVFRLDREKAALLGVQAQEVAVALKTALGGMDVAVLHKEGERKPLYVNVRLPEAERSGSQELSQLGIKTGGGRIVPLGELGKFEEANEERDIYHKDLKRVVYVFAEAAGVPPANVVMDLSDSFDKKPLPNGLSIEWAGEGEWFITLRVFRDLGIAFGAALIGIYIILAIQTDSFILPLVQMSAIPLTVIGILPGFFVLNLLTADDVGGFHNPVFFTATAMIGMIALGGIVIRNSSVLLNFIEERMAEGMAMKEAILESGIVRLRPIVLTALTSAVGVWPITLDPIFSGLGWALIFGMVVSTLFSLVIVPVIYWVIYRPSLSLDKKV